MKNYTHWIQMETFNYYVGRSAGVKTEVPVENSNIVAAFEYYKDAHNFVTSSNDGCNFYMIYGNDGDTIVSFAPKR